jgi:hypothetical protein
MVRRRLRRKSWAGLLAVTVTICIGVWWYVSRNDDNGRSDTQPASRRESAAAPAAAGRRIVLDVSDLDTTEEMLQAHLELLRTARDSLLTHADYSAVFVRQERVGGMLRDPETIDLLIRHEPFSTRMAWRESRREVAYLEGRNDGKMLVRLGGLGRVFGRIRMELDDPRVRAESRYPVTEVGLVKLIERIIGYRERDLTLREGQIRCEVAQEDSPDGRDSYRFKFLWSDAEVEPLYRKSVIWIDRTTGLPLAVRNFTWPDEDVQPLSDDELDAKTLIEDYVFRDLKFDRGLTDADFTRGSR